MPTQTEEDLAAGLLRVRLGGAEQIISALPAAQADVWILALDARLQELAKATATDETTLLQDTALATTVAADLIAQYDPKLGPATRIMAEATPQQIRRTLDAMRESALPFGDEVQMMTLFLAAAKAAQLAQQNSSNGHSTTGDQPVPRRSARRTRTPR